MASVPADCTPILTGGAAAPKASEASAAAKDPKVALQQAKERLGAWIKQTTQARPADGPNDVKETPVAAQPEPAPPAAKKARSVKQPKAQRGRGQDAVPAAAPSGPSAADGGDVSDSYDDDSGDDEPQQRSAPEPSAKKARRSAGHREPPAAPQPPAKAKRPSMSDLVRAEILRLEEERTEDLKRRELEEQGRRTSAAMTQVQWLAR